MIGATITASTLIINPLLGLLVGIAFGLFCYFIGRLTMSLDYRYQIKQATIRK